jgi:hypothetical protein
MGRPYDLEATFYGWTDLFPQKGEQTFAAHGRAPIVTWYGPGTASTSPFSLGPVISGQDDSWILTQARAFKQFGKPVWLQPMIEMNGNWYNGYSGNPTAFIEAWRRIYNLFASVGASNVIWVWCVNVQPFNWDAYYPGNSYVDVIGGDEFNNKAWSNSWTSFAQLFGPFFAHFAGVKPLLVGETGTNTITVNPGGWISGMRSYLETVAGPRYGVVAVCYYDTNTSSSGWDWRVDQTPASWKAWLEMAQDPYFGGHGAPLATSGSG